MRWIGSVWRSWAWGCRRGGEECEGAVGDVGDGPEAAEALVAAGEEAVFRADEVVAPGGEGGGVAGGGGVAPHFSVHGGGVEDGGAGGEADGAEGVVGEAVGEFR